MKKIVIIGSGMAGIGLADEVLNINPSELSVTVITMDKAGYYARPLLTHAFSNEERYSRILLKEFDKIREKGITVYDNSEVLQIDSQQQSLNFRQNTTETNISFDTLVLATGSAAFIPPPWRKNQQNFLVLNSLEDMQHIRNIRQKLGSVHWGIIGGGLIGCELVSDLNASGDQISLIHASDRLMERIFDQEKSDRLYHFFSEKGISIHLNTMVESISSANGHIEIQASDTSINVDQAIVAVGFRPRIELANQAGIKVNRGIMVNNRFETSLPNIYGIGDVAEVAGELYPFVAPIRAQVKWLAKSLSGQDQIDWAAPAFNAKAKIHGFA